MQSAECRVQNAECRMQSYMRPVGEGLAPPENKQVFGCKKQPVGESLGAPENKRLSCIKWERKANFPNQRNPARDYASNKKGD